jgi:CubicO group peptidase (beta-lactamase class C family)
MWQAVRGEGGRGARRAALCGLVLAGLAAACGDDPAAPRPLLPEELDTPFATLLDSLRYSNRLPALAAAIVSRDRVLDAAAVGSRRYGGPRDVTLADRFHIGSNQKAMTAALVGLLVADGALEWTSTVAELFPELAEITRPEYRDVNVLELLSHTHAFDLVLVELEGTPREEREQVVRAMVSQPTSLRRGEFRYGNRGYIMAGAIAERLGGGPAYEELLLERLIAPLGAGPAGYGPMAAPGRTDQPVQHRVEAGGFPFPLEDGPLADNPAAVSPAGRLHLPILGFAAFARFILQADAGASALIGAAAGRALTQPVAPIGPNLAYALGWYVGSAPGAGGRVLHHRGSNGLNYSFAWLAPERDFGIVIATNVGGSGVSARMEAVMARLLLFHLGRLP